MRSQLVSACLLALLLILPVSAQDDNVLILPGRGIGPVTFDLTDKEIHALGPVYEGYYFYHRRAWDMTSVWPDEPSKQIRVALADPPDEKPAYIIVSGTDTRYVLPNGLRLGSSLEEVQKLNGGPFALRGMYQDDAGEVLNWNDGKLAQAFEGVTLFLYPQVDVAALSDTEIEALHRPLLMSDSPILRKARVSTGKIQLSRPPAPISGPRYDELRPVVADPILFENKLISEVVFSGYTLIIEASTDDLQEHTFLRLYRTENHQRKEEVGTLELDFSWQADRLLTTHLEDGGPIAGIGLSGYQDGSLYVLLWSPTREEATFSIFSVIWSDSEYPQYQLSRSDQGQLQVHQVWKQRCGEVKEHPPEYRWNGRDFCFPNGSAFRFGEKYPKQSQVDP